MAKQQKSEEIKKRTKRELPKPEKLSGFEQYLAKKKKRMKSPPIPEERIAYAIDKCDGYLGLAAHMIDADPSTISHRVTNSSYLQEVRAMALERRLDKAEETLDKIIDDKNITAVMFFLKTKGKKRGYEQDESKIILSKDPLQFLIEKASGESRDLTDK